MGIFLLKLDETFKDQEIKIIVSTNLGRERNILQLLVDILSIGSGSVDTHIFAETNSGSRSVADPKYWTQL